MLSEEQIKALPDPAENFDELEKTWAFLLNLII